MKMSFFFEPPAAAFFLPGAPGGNLPAGGGNTPPAGGGNGDGAAATGGGNGDGPTAGAALSGAGGKAGGGNGGGASTIGGSAAGAGAGAASAGTAAAVFGFMQTVGGAVIGTFIGQQFNGSIVPPTIGWVVMGLLVLVCVLIAENGKLFGVGKEYQRASASALAE